MANRKYVKGANFERAFCKEIEKKGKYYAHRTAGSHSQIDVILIPREGSWEENVIVCQLKTYKKGRSKPKPSKDFLGYNCFRKAIKVWVTKQDFKKYEMDFLF